MHLQSAGALLVILVIASPSVRAVEVLDQQNDVGMSATADSAGPFSQEVGQTFKVGVAGTLSRIETQMNRPEFSLGGSVILTVYNTSAGAPNVSLGTVSLPWDAIPTGGFGYQSFNVSSLAISVQVNDVLAFGIKSSGDALFLLRSTFASDTYAGGEAKFRVLSAPPGPWTGFSPSHDTGFRTYVIPSALPLPGDYNNNGKVDAADYVIWRRHLGEPTEAALGGKGDNQNGVDSGDYLLWRSSFGAGGSGAGATSTAVPEPTLVILLSTTAIMCVAVRRSRLLDLLPIRADL